MTGGVTRAGAPTEAIPQEPAATARVTRTDEAAISPVETAEQVRLLRDAFQAGNPDRVKDALHGYSRADRRAIVSAFDRLPGNQSEYQSFQRRIARLGLPNDNDWMTIAASPTGRNDAVARLHRAMASGSVDRQEVLSLYGGRTRAEITALHAGYRDRHAPDMDVEAEIARRFGRTQQHDLAAARLGRDVRRPEHRTAAALADTTQVSGAFDGRARMLGEVLQNNQIDAVRRAYQEMLPGRSFDTDMLSDVRINQTWSGRASRARIQAALNGDRLDYVSQTALFLARGENYISEADARPAFGMVNGRDLAWADVEARLRNDTGGSITTALQARYTSGETRALLDQVMRPGAAPATIANQTEQPSVRLAAVEAALNEGNYLTSYRRRAAFSELLAGIPVADRAAIADAGRARPDSRGIEDQIRARFSGIEAERALADWRGNIDAIDMLRFASRGQATPQELTRAIASTSLERRAQLEAGFNERHADERSGGRTPFQTAVDRLRAADGEASRNLDLQLNLSRLGTPEGLREAQTRAQELLREGRGEWDSFRRFAMDTLKWSGPQLDASGRELFTNIRRAEREGRLREGQPVPAEIETAYRQVVADYQRYLRDQGRLGEAAAEVALFAGGTLLSIASGGTATGLILAAGASGGLYVTTRAAVSPVYADSSAGRLVTDAGTAAIGMAIPIAGRLGPAVTSVFSRYPTRTVLTFSNSTEQAAWAAAHIPGATPQQMEALIAATYSRNSGFVVGGSRIRGDFHGASDLDVGFTALSKRQAERVIAEHNKLAAAGDLPLRLETYAIVPGRASANVPEIMRVEEFFQRTGVRAPGDPRAGQSYVPSGSVSFWRDADGIYRVEIIPPGAL
ncbi:MAG: hypothetical protein ACAI38_02130 [Myxococcota bacterium]